MTWAQNPTGHEMMRQAEAWTDEVYTDYRNRGLMASVALEQTALDLGLTKRKTRSFLEGYANRVTAEQWRELRRRFLLHLENEVTYAMRRAAIRTARLKELEHSRAELQELRS